MKISKKMRAAILSLALILTTVVSAVAVSAYDGTADPLISLSYLRQFKSQEIDPTLAVLETRIAALEAEVAALAESGAGTQTPVVTSGVYAVVQLERGQKIIAGESCEIILRSGTASVILSAQSQGGISDITAGVDLANGVSASTNHLMLVPRDDGRGLVITSDIAYLMIKGAYSIE